MNNSTFYTIVVMSLMITVIIIYFIISIIQYHRKYIKLQKERIYAEITMQEKERKRIATDLHDSLGPILSAVKLNISSVDVQDPEDQHSIDNASRYIDEIIASMRQISYNLLPNTLERKGLVEALQEFTSLVNSRNTLTIQLIAQKEITILKEKEVHIFRMLQEILHNTIKHAKAKNLQIELAQKGNHLYITTKDDGVGFATEQMKATATGLGLKSIASRCELLGGKLNIESKANKGTSYLIDVPLP